jgi:thiaminase
MPPIPPYEVKEIVKESLNKEVRTFHCSQALAFLTHFAQIARLASLNASQKAATEPLIRAAERSRHELEMSLLELYAAAERRKAAAAQVEEARAGTLGIGGRHDYSTGVSDS